MASWSVPDSVHAGTVRARVLAEYARAGADGMTADQCAKARITELVLRHCRMGGAHERVVQALALCGAPVSGVVGCVLRVPVTGAKTGFPSISADARDGLNPRIS